MIKNYFLLILLLLPACTTAKKVNKPTKQVINLFDSVTVIRTLITKNKISEILEEADPEQINLLIDNFSPAQMALESEVLSSTIPLVLVYYFKDNAAEKDFVKNLESLAIEYQDKVKFVAVDSDSLFSLAENAEIDIYPTLLFVKNREIIDIIEQNITLDLIRKKIEQLGKDSN